MVSEIARLRPDANVLTWYTAHDEELALSSIVIAEISYGVERVRPDERGPRLGEALDRLMQRHSARIFGFNETTALIYGRIMGAAKRQGRLMSIPDGMIAAIALEHGAPLATRNASHFQIPDLQLIDPWTAR